MYSFVCVEMKVNDVDECFLRPHLFVIEHCLDFYWCDIFYNCGRAFGWCCIDREKPVVSKMGS